MSRPIGETSATITSHNTRATAGNRSDHGSDRWRQDMNVALFGCYPGFKYVRDGH